MSLLHPGGGCPEVRNHRNRGKQYKVAEGDTIVVERLDAPEGSQVELTRCRWLLVKMEESRHSLVEGAKVLASVVEHG